MTRRKDHVPVAWICNNCGEELPYSKNGKKEEKVKIEKSEAREEDK